MGGTPAAITRLAGVGKFSLGRRGNERTRTNLVSAPQMVRPEMVRGSWPWRPNPSAFFADETGSWRASNDSVSANGQTDAGHARFTSMGKGAGSQ